MSVTDSDFWSFTDSWLARLRPLEPIATDVEPDIRPLEDVRAVVFDIYGTLLISASGDVEVTRFSRAAVRESLAELRLVEGAEDRVPELFKETVRDHHRRSPHPHPEVDIIEVWRDITGRLKAEGLTRNGEAADPTRLALAFELAGNPVYPMPGMREVLRSLSGGDLPLGIVSNAQFFTPIVLNHFLGDLRPFQEDLTVYSYRLSRAKPDPYLFHALEPGLDRRGIARSQTLYVGNDMRNDVEAAARAGLRTVLFAGDRRSLRLREGEVDATVRPDRVICGLAELLTILQTDARGKNV